MKRINWILIFLFGILIWWIIIKFGPNTNNLLENISSISQDNNSNKIDLEKKYDRFEKIDNILDMWYYEKENIDSNHMIKEALKAYVNAIDDPYTVYMDAQQNSWFMQWLQWEDDFEWIWCVVTKKDYYVLIEEVLKESPAFKAGIMPLDRVIKINSWYVEDETLDDAVSRMRWPAWSTVNVTIERYSNNNWSWSNNNRKILEIEIIRWKINVPSVESKILNVWNKKIWYVEIFIIWEETEKLFKNEIKILQNTWVDWIILDLRWNGWWLMPIAVSIASHFIPKDKIVVSAKYKWYENENYYSKWYGEFEWLPIVVLVDWMTASAWEIIAMALQEQAWAKLLWTTTFGKWTIQTMNEFYDWDSIKYTIWKWFAPNKQNINKTWVKPDITVEFDLTWYINDNLDNQLEEAKSIFE